MYISNQTTMGGGLMQLVAYGAQDVYLTGNPQITFFKVVYRRHTNFSMEAIQQTFNGSADFGKKVTCTISRNGDLINRVYLQVDLPDVDVQGVAAGTGLNVPTGKVAFRWLNWLGHILIKNVEIEIGGQRIDKHYGEWLHIWNELTQTAGHQLGYANMVGNTPQLTNVTQKDNATGAPLTVKGQTLFIPLQFWFCRNAGLALPLIALQYHEVRINLELREATDCYWAAREMTSDSTATTPVLSWEEKSDLVSVPQGKLNASLYVDYIYLDTDERRRFAQVSHEYLIEQLQFTGDESTSNTNNKVKLNFNHPTKELIWVTQPDTFTDSGMPGGKQWFNWSDAADTTYGTYGGSNSAWNTTGTAPLANPDGLATNAAGTMPGVAAGGASLVHIPVSFEAGANPTDSAKLLLNGHDRFSERPGRYFNLVQPYQHHENVPSCGINVYSFGLKPEEHQPSGTCNMSRIDNATLQLTLTRNTVNNRTAKIKVFAVNYNVLRIQSGMGGLAYSN